MAPALPRFLTSAFTLLTASVFSKSVPMRASGTPLSPTPPTAVTGTARMRLTLARVRPTRSTTTARSVPRPSMPRRAEIVVRSAAPTAAQCASVSLQTAPTYTSTTATVLRLTLRLAATLASVTDVLTLSVLPSTASLVALCGRTAARRASASPTPRSARPLTRRAMLPTTRTAATSVVSTASPATKMAVKFASATRSAVPNLSA
mmetsp:Transcript_11385/g.36186  ORF Transcript_11385/g.36186 Transcript_11385/m.36186 type:complete len:205 (-) Transcript_11385:602-1216(-)